MRRYYYYSHLVGEDTEASRCDGTCQEHKADHPRVRFLIWLTAQSLLG